MAEGVSAPVAATGTQGLSTTQQASTPGTQVRPTATGGPGTQAVHPDDTALAAAQAARDKWGDDYNSSTHPLDHLLSKGGSMFDPNGNCIHCGADIETGATECDECNTNSRDHDKELVDFQFEHRDETSKQVQDAWSKTETALTKADAMSKKSSQKMHGL